jgi:hypothetical protein
LEQKKEMTKKTLKIRIFYSKACLLVLRSTPVLSHPICPYFSSAHACACARAGARARAYAPYSTKSGKAANVVEHAYAHATLTTYETGSSESQTDKTKETPEKKKNDQEINTASSIPLLQGIPISIPTKKPIELVKANPIPPNGEHKRTYRP